jgi:flagellar hook-associated protein 1 FlgK
MGNLMTSLLNTANALKVYEGALTVVQNNVTNADTPGYATQTASLVAMPFDLTVGLPGGVSLGVTQSSRNGFAEQAVRDQQTALGYYSQTVSDLTPLENYFSVSSTSGIGPALSNLFQSFSQLSVNPNDTVSRQAVLTQAATLAQNFNQTATGLLSQGTNLDQQTRGAIDTINQLASTIAQVNAQNRVDPQGGIDAGVDAELNSSLEQLSQVTNFTALQQPDGTVSVYIGGQTPLVVGDQVYAVQGDFSTPQTALLSSTGADISGQITGGQLSALLNDKNNLLPSYVTDLNTLAQNVADQVNSTLNSGIDQNGAAPATNLFNYDPVLGAAQTLSVNPLTPDQIAAALPGAPGGNGNALNLAALANTNSNGYTFAELYGNLGARVGTDVSSATDNQSTKQALLNQAQAMRQQISGVSLDQQAQYLLEYQSSYQAVSKMLSILDTLTNNLMTLIQ